jgi:integrase
MGQVYQQGSIRRVKRAKGGEVWEWRYRVRGKMRQQMFPVADFPTEKKLRQHLAASIAQLNGEQEAPLPIVTTVGGLIKRYRKEFLPELARSTRETYESTFTAQIIPQWSDKPIADLRPMAVDKWLKSLTVSAASKAKARRLLKQLLDKAMYWEYIPIGENPIKLVKVKGSTKRKKRIVLLTPEQVMDLIDALDEPYSLVILISACLGLRIEETSALQWEDINFGAMVVEIKRAWTHGEIKETKTPASEAIMPMPKEMADAILHYRTRPESKSGKWLFPATRGTSPGGPGLCCRTTSRRLRRSLACPTSAFIRSGTRTAHGWAEATPRSANRKT